MGEEGPDKLRTCKNVQREDWVPIGQGDAGCRRCGASVEDRDHIAFHCQGRTKGPWWTSWVEVESGGNWRVAESWFQVGWLLAGLYEG